MFANQDSLIEIGSEVKNLTQHVYFALEHKDHLAAVRFFLVEGNAFLEIHRDRVFSYLSRFKDEYMGEEKYDYQYMFKQKFTSAKIADSQKYHPAIYHNISAVVFGAKDPLTIERLQIKIFFNAIPYVDLSKN